MLLVLGIHFQPQMSTAWSNLIDDAIVTEEDWQPPWDKNMVTECEGYQAVYFDLPSQNYLVCGLEDFENVEDITDYAANHESIIIEKESHEFGPWINSFNGEEGNGWEFYIDGKRSIVGISEAELGPTSVVEWRMA